MDLDIPLLGAIIGTFLLAGAVKGVIGLGLPTVSLALLSAIAGLPVALQLMVIPSAVTNAWQALDGTALVPLLRRFWSLLITSFVGVWLAYGLLLVARPDAMTALLGVVLCVYAVFGLGAPSPRWRVSRESLVSPIVGLSTGALAGATGSLVMPVVAYLRALGLGRDALIQMMGLSFTVTTVAIGVAIADHGGFDDKLLGASIIALAPALIGMKLGQRLRRGVNEVVFARCMFLGLLVVGVHLIWKGIA